MRVIVLAAVLLLGAPGAWAQTLRFWTMQLSPHLDDYVHGLIARYEAAHPGIRIQWLDVPWSDMERKVLTALAAGEPPDVVNLNPQFAAKLAEFDALVDPERHLPAPVLARYLPQALAGNRLEGRGFALPWYLTTNLTLYRRESLARAGLDAPPRSHAELLHVAPRLAAAGGHAYFTALDGSHPLETLVAMGGRLLDARGCPALADAAGAEAFAFYRRLYAERLVPRNVVTEGHRKAVELFVAGELAMVSTGMQFLDAVRQNNPALYAQVEVAPPLAASGVAPNLAVMNLAVTARSAQRAAALDFAAFVTDPDNQLAFARRVPVLPSTRASYADPFLAATPASPDLMARARALSVATVLQGQVQVPPMRQYNKLRTSYTQQLQAQMLGRTAPDAALRTVQRQWADLLGCRP